MSFGTFEMSPVRFAGLAPHLQTEAVLLMAESGMAASRISERTGLDRQALVAIGSRRQGYRRSEPDSQVREPSSKPEKPKQAPGQIVLTAAAVAVLRLFREGHGEIRLSHGELEAQAGLDEGRGKRALNVLYERGLIYRIRAGMGGRPPIWSLTTDGARHSDLLFAGEDAPCCQTP